jgi:hypothetical protein
LMDRCVEERGEGVGRVEARGRGMIEGEREEAVEKKRNRTRDRDVERRAA